MMNSKKQIKSCLVISYGPVPTPESQTIEGGGMRAWGLAEGLHKNGVRVTVGINNSFPQTLKEHQGIKLVNWGMDQQFKDLINSYDAVIISYCMGAESVFVADNINDSVQLILDVYVPIYVEVSARESKDIDTEYRNYVEDIRRYNHVLRRGDYFLCNNEVQKTFYVGVLASLGIINPRSYRQDRILIAPFGVHDIPAKATHNPFTKLDGIKESDFVVMWFGAFYPWYRIEELLDSILALSKHKDFKFVVVGGKNPFNPNPDFFRQYDKALAFCEKHKLTNKSVFFVDHVPFDTRVNWFKHADVVISLNQEGSENAFAWRTRVMDMVMWGEAVVLTNGGDPISELLLANKAALRLPALSAAELTGALECVRKDRTVITNARMEIIKLKPTFYWHNITKPITEVIKAGDFPYKDEDSFRKKLHVSNQEADVPIPTGRLHKVKRLAKLPFRALSYARRKGLRRSVNLAMQIARTQTNARLVKRGKRYVFISHPMDNTGAPAVLMQIIREYAAARGAKNIQLVVPHISSNLLRELREMGVQVSKGAGVLGYRLLKLQLNLRKDDFVLINTIAVTDNYTNFIFRMLELNQLDHAYWFIHEDPAQIPVINPRLLDKGNLRRIQKLTNSKKLSVVTPSKRTKKEYTEILGTKSVQTIPLLVDVPKKYQIDRPAKDYSSLRFYLSGAAGDGRKGQFIAIVALNDFLMRYYKKNPEAYRDFALVFVSVGHQDYLSQQIRWIGNSLLGKRIEIHEQLPRDEGLAIASHCNVVLCCSLNETFGLYIAEAMRMGHVVLRNNAAGMEEQLKDGVNGYFIDHTDVQQIADVIEKILNKKKTSDEDLQKMGVASQKIIANYGKNDYLKKIESLD